MDGYGWGLICEMPAHLVVLFFIGVRVGNPRMKEPLLWALAFALPLFAWRLGWPLGWFTLGLLALPLACPSTRRQIREFIHIALPRAPVVAAPE
jgi:hypothetical protein